MNESSTTNSESQDTTMSDTKICALEIEDLCFSYASASESVSAEANAEAAADTDTSAEANAEAAADADASSEANADGNAKTNTNTGSSLPPKQLFNNLSLSIENGAFCLLVGDTGCGKTTLMRLCKPEIAPAGERGGSIRVFGNDVYALTPSESAEAVGYVFQNPDNQIVCDSVWHEMAFGLENLGIAVDEMRRRIAETCYFFGMEPWFHAHTADLSGGQRQLLALAATIAMRPRLLLLDEPTAMLDPVAEKNFLSLLFRVNRELGCTVVVATHTPESMVDYATCAFRMSENSISQISLDALRDANRLALHEHKLLNVAPKTAKPASKADGSTVAISLRELWYRYSRESDWVLTSARTSICAGEVRALVGANGCGKSTLLMAIAGIIRPQRGRVINTLKHSQAYLPQSPKALLSCESVKKELSEWSKNIGYGSEEILQMSKRIGLKDALERHPYDLSGGQQQLLALAKLLLTKPRLLLLDEPTKGLDQHFRVAVADMVEEARQQGTTIVMSTHDLVFAHEMADSCSMIFDGQFALTQPSHEFFADSWIWRP